MTSMGWSRRAFKPYSDAEPDPRPSPRDILGVDQCLEHSNPRAEELLHPPGNGHAVQYTPSQHPRLFEPERGAHHPLATRPEPSHPVRRLHQRRWNSCWLGSIPTPLHAAPRVQRDPIALPARMPEPGPDLGEGSILMLIPSQGMLQVARRLPQPELQQGTGTGRDQAQSHDHKLKAPPAQGEGNASTRGVPANRPQQFRRERLRRVPPSLGSDQGWPAVLSSQSPQGWSVPSTVPRPLGARRSP